MSGLIFRSLILLAAFALSVGSHAAQGLPAQISSETGVTIKVVPRDLQGPLWDFEVTLDTHSQDLQDDLVKNTVLIKADGTSASPVAWQGDPPSGHHRKGVLRFDAIAPPPATLEMRIIRPGETKPRSFQWTLK